MSKQSFSGEIDYLQADRSHYDSDLSKLMELLAGNDWISLAACAQKRGVDSEIFFAEESNKYAIKMAKEVCAHCVVREKCFDYAMKTNEAFGVWGGFTAKERLIPRRIRRS